MVAEVGQEPPGGLARFVPGVRVVRTYDRQWLRSDAVAGIVLAAILVPQGMAYAELAGLPAVTGLYTTIACLVGYALMGPSRVLVLGPDSSVSPMIFAAIAPIVLVGDDPAKAVTLAGMMAVLVGIIEIGLGLGKLGLRGRPPLQRGSGRLHERSRAHHHRGPTPEVVRLLDRRRQLHRRAQGLLRRASTSATRRPSSSAWRRSWSCSCCRDSRGRSRPSWSRSSVPPSSRPSSTSTSRRSVPCRAACLARRCRGPNVGATSAPMLVAAVGHHARVAHRHDRHVDGLRRPAGRRGRPEPGDDRHRHGQHRRRLLPGVRRLHQRLPHRRGRAVGGQEPAHEHRRCRGWSPCCSSSSRRCSPISRRPTLGRRRHRRRALAGRPGGARPLRPCAASRR